RILANISCTKAFSLATTAKPSTASCQLSCAPTSEMATLNLSRVRSLMLRSTIRFSFSEWLPGAINVRRQTPTITLKISSLEGPCARASRLRPRKLAGTGGGARGPLARRSQGGRFLHDFVGLEHIADLDVVEALDREAALVAGHDLAHVVLEAL